MNTDELNACIQELISFLLRRASELRINNGQMPFADLHESYGKALSEYVRVTENSIAAHRASIHALEAALASVNREIAS